MDAVDIEFNRIHYSNGNDRYGLAHSSGVGFQSYDFNDVLAQEGEI
ncbi:hypothetical protein [Aeromonas phage vB_AsM_ZHF]|uniref:Uncharacterized protein n=1 Tax=Aeromonas phage vB_AsM_ZHF TaxID=2812849 RepID=A0A898K9F3_9CAUD|nr:hypothetical protein [Aeromonas phage vB_AsM_ZHF]UIW13090.1 hypothetical protein Ah13A_154 [Aeromonas phage AhMtk13a]